MGAIVEVSYFNSYKLVSLGTGTSSAYGSYAGLPWNPPGYPEFPVNADIDAADPNTTEDQKYEWYIEEARIRGGYNNTSVAFGPRAYISEDNDDAQIFGNSLIYSGVFNSRTDVNQTNVFSVGEQITRSLDPRYGSINLIYARDTDLTVFQQNKTNRALIDKDAIYSAEGTSTITTAQAVIGTITPYEGDYGISNQPESFAKYGFRRYFSDVNRGAIMRLSRDGLTEISQYGMSDYFRDELSSVNNDFQIFSLTAIISNVSGATFVATQSDAAHIQVGMQLQFAGGQTAYVNRFNSNTRTVTVSETITGTPATVIISKSVKDKVLGAWDSHSKNYVLSIQPALTSSNQNDNFKTLNFDDNVNGWVSFFTYKPTDAESLKNIYYTFKDATLYRHYAGNSRNNFYGDYQPSNVEFIFNVSPSNKKLFQTVNYEGYSGWEITSFRSDETGIDEGAFYNDSTQSVKSYNEGLYTDPITGQPLRAGFTRKENLYTANLVNNSPAMPGEVLFGNSISGIKGYFSTVTIQTDATTDISGAKELFAVGATFVGLS